MLLYFLVIDSNVNGDLYVFPYIHLEQMQTFQKYYNTTSFRYTSINQLILKSSTILPSYMPVFRHNNSSQNESGIRYITESQIVIVCLLPILHFLSTSMYICFLSNCSVFIYLLCCFRCIVCVCLFPIIRVCLSVYMSVIHSIVLSLAILIVVSVYFLLFMSVS